MPLHEHFRSHIIIVNAVINGLKVFSIIWVKAHLFFNRNTKFIFNIYPHSDNIKRPVIYSRPMLVIGKAVSKH